MCCSSTIYIAGILHNDIANGLGLRCTVFVQGCPHHCVGCHSPHTWKVHSGTAMSVEELIKEIDKNPIDTGLTLSGGEPIDQYLNLLEVLSRVKHFNDVMLFTGYSKEQLNNFILTKPQFKYFLSKINTVVCDPFVLSLRDTTLKFRGSSNQRVCRVMMVDDNPTLIDITSEWDDK
jgi:anaerobic ribonucleoside-triphosphate reductase activating protein